MCGGKKNKPAEVIPQQTVQPAATAAPVAAPAAQPVAAQPVATGATTTDPTRGSGASVKQDTPQDGVDVGIANSGTADTTINLAGVNKKRKTLVGLDL